MYQHGQGVPQDDVEAVQWYRLAADQGYATAQGHLGFMYGEGRGVVHDEAEAVRWFRRAANQGDAGAQATLGGLYVTGEGVSPDYVQAHMWISLAAARSTGKASNGSVETQKRLSRLMTREQLVEAERRAREWTPTPQP